MTLAQCHFNWCSFSCTLVESLVDFISRKRRLSSSKSRGVEFTLFGRSLIYSRHKTVSCDTQEVTGVEIDICRYLVTEWTRGLASLTVTGTRTTCMYTNSEHIYQFNVHK